MSYIYTNKNTWELHNEPDDPVLSEFVKEHNQKYYNTAMLYGGQSPVNTSYAGLLLANRGTEEQRTEARERAYAAATESVHNAAVIAAAAGADAVVRATSNPGTSTDTFDDEFDQFESALANSMKIAKLSSIAQGMMPRPAKRTKRSQAEIDHSMLMARERDLEREEQLRQVIGQTDDGRWSDHGSRSYESSSEEE